MKKRILPYILSVIMLLGMTACQTSQPPATEASSAGTTSTTDSTAPSGAAAVKLPDAEFTYFVPDPSLKIPPDDAPVMKQIYDLTGVRIKFIVPPAEPLERLSVMLAADDLPDLIKFSNPTIMKQFIDAGKIIRLNELLQQNCPNVLNVNWKDFINRLYDDKGNLYYLPYEYTIGGLEGLMPESTIGLSARTAYFEENGYDKLPETFDQYKALLSEIKAKYPSMSPVSLALGAQGQLNHLISMASSAYGLEESSKGNDTTVENQGLVRKDGKLFYFTQVPEVKQFFAFLNSLNLEGYLDKESPVLSLETLKQKCVAGKVWSYLGDFGEIDLEVNAYEQEKGSNEIMLGANFLKADDSIKKTAYSRSPLNLYNYGITITNKCADPARFLKFYDYCNTEEGRINTTGTVNWDFTGENTVDRTEGYNLIVRRDTHSKPGRDDVAFSAWCGQQWEQDENWYWNFGVEYMYDFTFRNGNYPGGKYNVMEEDVGMWWSENRARIYKEAFGWSGTSYFPAMRDMWVDTSEFTDLQLDPASDEYADKLAVEALYAKYLPRAIMAKSAADFETQWAAMNAEMDKAGLQAYMAKCNELYNARVQQWSNTK